MKKLRLLIVIYFLCASPTPAQTSSATPQPPVVFARREASPFKAKRTKLQRQRLLPDATDAAKYRAFLGNPNTGLVKIFSDTGCENNANIVRADADCLSSIPNSAFYSFREKEHTNEYLSDVSVKNGFFVADGILSQGILVALGDVSLENLSLKSEGLKFLLEFAPDANSEEALKQTMQITRGARSGGFLYKKTLPIEENTTYAMRVVAYRGKFWRTFNGILYNVLRGDARADLTLGFRVVRKSDDGSVTLLWKELQRKEAPKIIFPKRNKKANK